MDERQNRIRECACRDGIGLQCSELALVLPSLISNPWAQLGLCTGQPGLESRLWMAESARESCRVCSYPDKYKGPVKGLLGCVSCSAPWDPSPLKLWISPLWRLGLKYADPLFHIRERCPSAFLSLLRSRLCPSSVKETPPFSGGRGAVWLTRTTASAWSCLEYGLCPSANAATTTTVHYSSSLWVWVPSFQPQTLLFPKLTRQWGSERPDKLAESHSSCYQGRDISTGEGNQHGLTCKVSEFGVTCWPSEGASVCPGTSGSLGGTNVDSGLAVSWFFLHP